MAWEREVNVRGPQGPAGPVDPNDPVLVQAANDAVAVKVAEVGLVSAIPTRSYTPSSRTTLPLSWADKQLRSTYPSTYPETYVGSWVTGDLFGKHVALVEEAGTLSDALIPPTVARASDLSKVAESVSQTAETRIHRDLPVFGARVAAAATLSLPVAVVLVGSSTTAANPGYTSRLTKLTQAAYPVSSQSVPVWSTSATFTRRDTAGIHVYNAGEGSTVSADYLTDAECDRIAALNPGLIIHMVGSNDFRNRVHPAQYETNMRSRLMALDSRLTVPCQHMLVHAYERFDSMSPVATWAQYGAALERVAAGRPDTVFVDLSGAYVAVGVPSSDPLGLIGPDHVHQTSQGYRFMADQLSQHITA